MILIDKAISLYTGNIINIMDFDRQSEIYQNDFECPFCGAKLIARKGSINAHHFASREAHSEDCPYEVSNFTDSEANQKIKIYLPDFDKSSVKSSEKTISHSGETKNIITTNTISDLKSLVEIDSLISNGSLTRTEISGISGRNRDNFYIKELSKEVIEKIIEYNQRNSLTPYVFQGVVSKAWNYYRLGAFLNINGKYIHGKSTSVKIKVKNNRFKEETINLWNEENFEIAVLGIPVIEENEHFRSIIIEIQREKISERIYEFA